MKKTQQKRRGIYMRYMTITPKIADEWLSSNKHKNRRQGKELVARYGSFMKTGDWIGDNGETIKLTRSGALIDGQHRLRAIIRTGKTMKMCVCFNVHPKAFQTLDRGKRRTCADTLHIHGEVKTEALSSAITMVHQYKKNTLRKRGSFLTPKQTMAFLHSNPSIRDSIAFGFRFKVKSLFLSRSQAAFLHFIFSRKNNKKAETFLTNLMEGINIKRGDAIHTLHKKLLANCTNLLKMTKPERLAICIKAFNKWMEGESASVLSYNSDKEKYPKVLK